MHGDDPMAVVGLGVVIREQRRPLTTTAHDNNVGLADRTASCQQGAMAPHGSDAARQDCSSPSRTTNTGHGAFFIT